MNTGCFKRKFFRLNNQCFCFVDNCNIRRTALDKEYYANIEGLDYQVLLNLLIGYAVMFAFATRTDIGINQKKKHLSRLKKQFDIVGG